VETWIQTQAIPVDICAVQSDFVANVSIFPLLLTFILKVVVSEGQAGKVR
jgi:hypothetical protein